MRIIHVVLWGIMIYCLVTAFWWLGILLILISIALFSRSKDPQIKWDVMNAWHRAYDEKMAEGRYSMPSATEVYDWMNKNGKKYSRDQVRIAYFRYIEPTLRVA